MLQKTAIAIIVTIIALFIGLFMISKVASITAINSTSDFYNTYHDLVIVAALGVALAYLGVFTGGASAAATV